MIGGVDWGPPHDHPTASFLAHEVCYSVQHPDENHIGCINFEVVLRLQLYDLVEQVPDEAVDGEVLFEVMLLIEFVFVLDHRLDDPIEVFVIISYQLLEIRSLRNQSFDVLPAGLIVEHQRKDG